MSTTLDTGTAFVAGTTIVASAMNTRFTNIETWANGTPNLGTAGSPTTIKGSLVVNQAATLDATLAVTGTATFSGNIDVDGTTNLDAVDIDGAVQIDNTVSVGVDGTGYNVQFYSGVAGDFLLYNGALKVEGPKTGTNEAQHDTANTGLFILGESAGQHLAMDGNEIMAKETGTTVGTLHLQNNGGTIKFGNSNAVTLFEVNGPTTLTGLTMANGTVSAPTLLFNNSTSNSGFYGKTTDQIGLSSDGYNAMISTNGTGSTGAGGTIATAYLATASLDDYSTVYRHNGFATLAISSSQRAHKENIESVSGSGTIIDALEPVTFIAKAVSEETAEQKTWREGRINYGFIAEDVAELANGNLATFTVKDGSFIPTNWRERDIISVVVAELKSVRQRLAALEA